MNGKIAQILTFVLIVFVFSSCFDSLKSGKQAIQTYDESPMAILLENTLKNANDSTFLAFRGKQIFTSKMIKEFYLLNKNFPVWTSRMKPNEHATELLHLFGRARYFGLDTSFYQYTELKELFASLTEPNGTELNKKALDFELLMTHNCFRLMSNLHSGILYADTSIYGYNSNKYPSNYPKKLAQFINDGKLSKGILDLQPRSYEYRRLVSGLEHFLDKMVLTGDSNLIPDPAVDSMYAYQKARKILIGINYLQSEEYTPTECLFNKTENLNQFNQAESIGFSFCSHEDSLFMNALKVFQKDHGLSPDGKIGYNTVKALQQNNQDRFEQIAINMERLKWEKVRPAKYVYVNLPSYKLRVINDYAIIKTLNVVVGAQRTETPLLNSKIEYFITNPEWNVPYSITSNEILPKIRKDSTYLARHNYKIFDKNRNPVKEINWSEIEGGNVGYSIQQGSGSGNALGKIKFIFPNPYSVYIHDTQDKSKFSKDIRAYSHGCMRVQDPNELAKTLLELEPNNMADSVDIWLSRSNSKKIDLPEPIPVYVRYVTCEADSKGNITFYQDIYGKDNKLKALLFAQKDI